MPAKNGAAVGRVAIIDGTGNCSGVVSGAYVCGCGSLDSFPTDQWASRHRSRQPLIRDDVGLKPFVMAVLLKINLLACNPLWDRTDPCPNHCLDHRAGTQIKKGELS